MSKVAVIAKISALPGRRDEVVAALSKVVDAAQDEPGTLFYAMHADKTDAEVVWFYELYADDAAFAAHGGSEAMKAAGGELRDKVGGRPELFFLDVLGGKGIPD
jgi:quinol monooxygenase YgiN